MSRKTITESVSRDVVTCDVCGGGQFHCRCAICKKDVCLSCQTRLPTSLQTGDDLMSDSVCGKCLPREDRDKLIDRIIAMHRKVHRDWYDAIAKLFDELRQPRT